MGETERKLLQIYLIELCHEIEQLTHLECEDYELYVRDDREFPLLKTIYSALIFLNRIMCAPSPHQACSTSPPIICTLWHRRRRQRQ